MRLLLLLLLALGLLSGIPASEQGVAVIAHPDVPADTLSQARVFDIYAQDVKFWDGHLPVELFDLRERGDTKRMFYRYLGKSTTQMKSIWMKRLLLGESRPPTGVDSDAAMLESIATTPGAIGYVSVDVDRSAVKTLTIVTDQP